MRTKLGRIWKVFGIELKIGIIWILFNLSALLEYDDDNLDLSDEYNNVTFYFIIVFIANAIKYDARDVKNQLEIWKAVHILKSMIKKP